MSDRALPSLERPPWLEEAVGKASGRGVRIAMVDSGRDPGWAEGRILPGFGLVHPQRPFEVERSADDADRIGHGTACCDVVLGLAPGVEIVPIRVFGERLETSPAVLLAALEAALESGARIVNLSLGTRLEAAREPLFRATRVALDCGLLTVAALPAGASPSLPAAFPHVVAVAAGRFASAYDFEYGGGEAIRCRAQGERQVRWLGGELRITAGASLAAPHVTALLALLLEAQPAAGPAEVRAFLGRYSLAARRVLAVPE